MRVKISAEKKVTDMVQNIYDMLAQQNDGNKNYKINKVSLSKDGQPLKNYASYIQTYFDDEQTFWVHVDIGVDTTKSVKPIAVSAPSLANKKLKNPNCHLTSPSPHAECTSHHYLANLASLTTLAVNANLAEES